MDRPVSGPCTSGMGRPIQFCGLCYENIRGRAARKGHRHYRSAPRAPRTNWEEIMKRREAPRPGKKGEVVYPDPAFAKDYPALALGMCDGLWEDGKPREVWTISVRMKEKGVLVTTTDKNYGECLYTEGEDLLSALALVEEALSQGTASWRKFSRK